LLGIEDFPVNLKLVPIVQDVRNSILEFLPMHVVYLYCNCIHLGLYVQYVAAYHTEYWGFILTNFGDDNHQCGLAPVSSKPNVVKLFSSYHNYAYAGAVEK
jgi:hypothetical protein